MRGLRPRAGRAPRLRPHPHITPKPMLRVAGRPVIFRRDSKGEIRLFLNTCRHRGAMVCREAEGNAHRYYCFYHG